MSAASALARLGRGALAGPGPLPVGRPPARRFLVEEWSLTTVAELAAVRARLASRLVPATSTRVPGEPRTPERIVLVASELGTNALCHGRAPAAVRLLRDARAWILEVTDQAPEVAPSYAAERAAGAGGLGLHLAHRLALELGWFTDGDTKTVWAAFAA